jgi:hypothetical protein
MPSDSYSPPGLSLHQCLTHMCHRRPVQWAHLMSRYQGTLQLRTSICRTVTAPRQSSNVCLPSSSRRQAPPSDVTSVLIQASDVSSCPYVTRVLKLIEWRGPRGREFGGGRRFYSGVCGPLNTCTHISNIFNTNTNNNGRAEHLEGRGKVKVKR